MVSDGQIFTEADYDLLQQCVHCGLCLSSCPTYLVNGQETNSPRGRILLMSMIENVSDEVLNGVFEHIDLCLGCLACQTACPSGVQYEHLLDKTRAYQTEKIAPLSLRKKLMLQWFTNPTLLSWFTRLLRLIQRLGLPRLIMALKLLPPAYRLQLAGLPRLKSAPFSHSNHGLHLATHPGGSRRGAVALFTGCVMDQWYHDVHQATLRILRWNGYDVAIPPDQVCCGALHAHAGSFDEADKLVQTNANIFNSGDYQTIIVNAAGCGAHLKTNFPLKNGGPVIKDIIEWLADNLHNHPKYKLPARTAYDAPCHLLHAQGIQQAPHTILKAACSNVVHLPEADICCGSAGFYSLEQAAMSQDVLSRKVDNINSVSPDLLVTANPGCQMQLQGGLAMGGWDIPVYHVIQVLDQAYRLDEAYRSVYQLEE